MIDVIYDGALTDEDLRRVSLPRKRVRVSRPTFFTADDLRKMFEGAWVLNEISIRDELQALLDEGKPIGPTFRRHAALLHPSGWGIYHVGADRELTVASPDVHKSHSVACAAARSMDAKGGHLVAVWTDRSAVVTVIDVTEDFTVIVTPFGEQGMWRSRAGVWRTAVPDATGRMLGCNRSEAAKAAGELVGARFDTVPSDADHAPGTDYVKFAGLVDVYDVDDCTQEVMP